MSAITWLHPTPCLRTPKGTEPSNVTIFLRQTGRRGFQSNFSCSLRRSDQFKVSMASKCCQCQEVDREIPTLLPCLPPTLGHKNPQFLPAIPNSCGLAMPSHINSQQRRDAAGSVGAMVKPWLQPPAAKDGPPQNSRHGSSFALTATKLNRTPLKPPI